MSMDFTTPPYIREPTPASKVWLAMLTATGGTLIIFGLVADHCCDYHKLFISIGIILLMCAMLLASFFFFDSKSFQKYTLHILVPWLLCSIIILFGIVIAFSLNLINVAFVFSEIFHYLGRMRVRPLRLQLKEITKGDSYQKPLLSSSSQASWTSRVITLTSSSVKENGGQNSDSMAEHPPLNKLGSASMSYNNGGFSSERSSTLSHSSAPKSGGIGGRQQTVLIEETETHLNQRNQNSSSTPFKSDEQLQLVTVSATSNGESGENKPRFVTEHNINEIYQKRLIRNSLSPAYSKPKPLTVNNKRQQTQRVPKKGKNNAPYLTNWKFADVKWLPSEVLRKK